MLKLPEVEKFAKVFGIVFTVKSESETMIPQYNVFSRSADFRLLGYLQL